MQGERKCSEWHLVGWEAGSWIDLEAEGRVWSQGLDGNEDGITTHMHHSLHSVRDGKKRKRAEMAGHAVTGKRLLRMKSEYLCRS